MRYAGYLIYSMMMLFRGHCGRISRLDVSPA